MDTKKFPVIWFIEYLKGRFCVGKIFDNLNWVDPSFYHPHVASSSPRRKCFIFGFWTFWQNRKINDFSVFFPHRNCIIGPQLDVKICALGTVINRLSYPADYCHLEGAGRQSQPMPIRWMSWESVLMVSSILFSPILDDALDFGWIVRPGFSIIKLWITNWDS